VELGAGTPPGIRMKSGTHIHLTAAKPRSTISLGVAAGEGVENSTDGIAIATEGDCNEKIRGNHYGSVDKQRIQTIKENETLFVDGERKARIKKDDSLQVSGDQETTVDGSYRLETGKREEEVHGDYVLKIHGKLKKQEDQEETIVVSHKRETRIGTSNEVCIGEKGEACIGGKLEYTLAYNRESHVFYQEKCLFKLENAKIKVAKEGVEVHHVETGIHVAKAKIYNAVMSIFK
jgi:hypothetical protein